jgi:hypothetical protein
MSFDEIIYNKFHKQALEGFVEAADKILSKAGVLPSKKIEFMITSLCENIYSCYAMIQDKDIKQLIIDKINLLLESMKEALNIDLSSDIFTTSKNKDIQ